MRHIPKALLALALAFGWELSPPAAEPVSAACTTGSCATLEVVFSPGNGSGLVTTFPLAMDCTWTGAAREGTCVVQFDVGSGLEVTLYLDPGVHSYACYGLACGGLEARMEQRITLHAGDDIDVFPAFNLGVKANVEMRMAGNGDGRVTTVPAGLNCRWLDGVKSGTCSADYWFAPAASYSIQLIRTPDTGSYACSDGPPHCGTPDQPYVSTLGVSPEYSSAPPATFYEARPVAVTVTGSGSVVSNPAGISCPSTCSVWLPPNYSDDPPQSTSLTASPAAGWFIKDWSGACDGTVGATCKFFNSGFGITAGVVFARTSTPAPPATSAPTPRPTAKPTPRPSVGQVPTPAVSTPAPTAAPTAAAPAATSAPVETGVPASLPPPTAGPVALASGSPGPLETVLPSQPVEPVVDPGSQGRAISPWMIVLAVLVMVALFVAAFVAGRRRRKA